LPLFLSSREYGTIGDGHGVETSDFDTHMLGINILRGDENPTPVVACILDFLVHRKYTSILLEMKTFFFE
jgi:hypothetical protein